MKNKMLPAFVAILLVAAPFSSNASRAVAPAEMRIELMAKTKAGLAESRTNKKADRKLRRLEKRLEKFSADGPDFSDPVDKWLWFGLFGLGGAIVLSLISFGLAGLIGFLAIVCLVIWIIKREQASA